MSQPDSQETLQMGPGPNDLASEDSDAVGPPDDSSEDSDVVVVHDPPEVKTTGVSLLSDKATDLLDKLAHMSMVVMSWQIVHPQVHPIKKSIDDLSLELEHLSLELKHFLGPESTSATIPPRWITMFEVVVEKFHELGRDTKKCENIEG